MRTVVKVFSANGDAFILVAVLRAEIINNKINSI